MPDFGLTPRERLVPRRLLVHFSGSGSGLPGLHMDRVLGALRPAFLLAVLAAAKNPPYGTEPLSTAEVCSSIESAPLHVVSAEQP